MANEKKKKGRKPRALRSKKKIKGGVSLQVSATGCHDPGLSNVKAMACNDFGYQKVK